VAGELEVHVVEVRLVQCEPLDVYAGLGGRGDVAHLADRLGAAATGSDPHGQSRAVGSDLERAERGREPAEVGAGGSDQVKLELRARALSSAGVPVATTCPASMNTTYPARGVCLVVPSA
jgi:hypothetical protein